MSDSPKRSVEVIHQEYSQMCAKAGHLQYQIAVMKKDLDLINEQLKDLNLEAAKLSSESKEQSSEGSAS